MKTKRIVLIVASVALALVMLFACLYWLPTVATRGAEALTETAADSALQANGPRAASRDAELPEPTAEYNFKSSAFDGNAWHAQHGEDGVQPKVSAGTGLQITGGNQDPDATSSYGIANPLKGRLTDGFTVVVHASVTAFIDDSRCLFGFVKADSEKPVYSGNTFMFVASSGNGVHFNDIGTSRNGDDYYDITPNKALSMTEVSQYIITVTDTVITIYLDGAQVAQYREGTDFNKTYDCQTVSFVNNANWFMFGRACNFWGTGTATVEDAALYNMALTAEQIAAINAAAADFTALNASIAAAQEVDLTNYNTDAQGWGAAYGAFTSALAAARELPWNASQGDVDAARAALESAMQALAAFERTPDLTDSLVAAYPLSDGGGNLVGTDRDEVLFMNGTQTMPLTGADRFGRRQTVTGAKLYLDSNLGDREMIDTSATPTTGLKIPADAFEDVTTDTGMTLTVSVYAYNFYKPFSRIFQLGTKASAVDGANGAQLYLMVTGGLQCGNGGNIYVDNAVVGTYIAAEWITVSLVFSPNGTFRAYMSSNTSDRVNGGIARYSYTNKTNVDTVLNAIINGQDNWIGRSYWSADGNLVGLASNLSVYNRALSKAEVELLHHTGDLSSLIA